MDNGYIQGQNDAMRIAAGKREKNKLSATSWTWMINAGPIR
jgi:hypothetical protein